MTGGKTYVLKLKSSARKSIWCGCSRERVLLALYLISFQTYDKTVSSGEHLLQLCSQSLILDAVCLELCSSVVDFRHWRLWGKNRASPFLLQLSPRCSHAFSFRDYFYYHVSELGQKVQWLECFEPQTAVMKDCCSFHGQKKVAGMMGWQPGYSWQSCRMVLQMGAAPNSFIVFLGQNSQVCGVTYYITIENLICQLSFCLDVRGHKGVLVCVSQVGGAVCSLAGEHLCEWE